MQENMHLFNVGSRFQFVSKFPSLHSLGYLFIYWKGISVLGNRHK